MVAPKSGFTRVRMLLEDKLMNTDLAVALYCGDTAIVRTLLSLQDVGIQYETGDVTDDAAEEMTEEQWDERVVSFTLIGDYVETTDLPERFFSCEVTFPVTAANGLETTIGEDGIHIEDAGPWYMVLKPLRLPIRRRLRSVVDGLTD